MGAEAILFTLAGGVALLAAAGMLLSQNAVHSALFLIVNFISVAFLYLLLEAPFLAMVQIAVYAGAIMVLFLFVIMLLGAERTPVGHRNRQFRWLAPVTLALALSFLFAAGLAIFQGNIDGQELPEGEALLRVVHAVPEVFPDPEREDEPSEITRIIEDRRFDVYIDGVLFAEDIAFDSVTDFTPFAPGTYSVTLNPTGTEVPLVTGEVELASRAVVTAIAYETADGQIVLDSFTRDQTSVARNESRALLFNANPQFETISLVNIESELSDNARSVTPVIDQLAFGEVSESVVYPSRFPNWVVIEGGRAEDVQGGNTNPVLVRLPDLDIEDETQNLLVFVGERSFTDGSLVPSVFNLVDETVPAFGSPQSIGETLFIDYMLPFQLVAVLLLAAMIGVIVMTHRTEHEPKPSRLTRRKVSRPLTSVIAAQTGSDLEQDAPRLTAPEEDDELASQPEPGGD